MTEEQHEKNAHRLVPYIISLCLVIVGVVIGTFVGETHFDPCTECPHHYTEMMDSLQKVYKLPSPRALVVADIVGTTCDRFKVDWRQVVAVMAWESAYTFDSYLIGKCGEIGAMQIMPETGQVLAQELNISFPDEGRLFDLSTNVTIAVYFMAKLSIALNGNYENVVKAYNCGLPNFYAGAFVPEHWQAVLKEYKKLCR